MTTIKTPISDYVGFTVDITLPHLYNLPEGTIVETKNGHHPQKYVFNNNVFCKHLVGNPIDPSLPFYRTKSNCECFIIQTSDPDNPNETLTIPRPTLTETIKTRVEDALANATQITYNALFRNPETRLFEPSQLVFSRHHNLYYLRIDTPPQHENIVYPNRNPQPCFIPYNATIAITLHFFDNQKNISSGDRSGPHGFDTTQNLFHWIETELGENPFIIPTFNNKNTP